MDTNESNVIAFHATELEIDTPTTVEEAELAHIEVAEFLGIPLVSAETSETEPEQLVEPPPYQETTEPTETDEPETVDEVEKQLASFLVMVNEYLAQNGRDPVKFTSVIPDIPRSSGYVKLPPDEAKARRIAAAHKRWATIKARRTAMRATSGPMGPRNASR